MGDDWSVGDMADDWSMGYMSDGLESNRKLEQTLPSGLKVLLEQRS